MPNIEKYLNNLVVGEECMIYKISEEEFNTCDDNTIVYISSYGIEELEESLENGEDLTDEQILSKYIGYSKKTIEKLLLFEGFPMEQIINDGLVYDVYNNYTWQYATTYIKDLLYFNEEYLNCD